MVDEHFGGSSAKLRWVEKWSSKYDWVARAEAWDAHELAEKTAARQQIRERARQKIIDKLDELIDEALDIALGDNPKANNTQAKVLLDALDRAGITVPKDINLNLSDKRDRIQELSRDVDSLEDDELIELIEASSQDTGEGSE